MSRRNPGPVPKRWLKCPRRADNLISGKFMAFKTPLSKDFDDQVPAQYRFYPKMIFDLSKTRKINFGLWIDLTNTDRFYDKTEIQRNDCKYVKLPCRGHGETPSKDQTNLFIDVCRTFIAQNPLKAIAVHCTHGFNRTGFLIVSYLVNANDCSLDIALSEFNNARRPGIYKQDYLVELYTRYDDVEDVPNAPGLPDWCFEDEGEDDDEGTSNSSQYSRQTESNSKQNSNNQSFKQNRRNGKKAQFMEGVDGVVHFVDQPKASQLQKKAQVMCEWRSKGFPGSQPVSMDGNNIKLLQTQPYMVSWKADGTRYMMLIDGRNEVYFFDRDNNVFLVKGLRFPRRKNLNEDLKHTLIDGEMVIDKVGDQNIARYLVYDIIKFEGEDVGKTSFASTRLMCIENEIIKPRHNAMQQGIINKADEPFSVRNKQFWHVKQAASLLSDKFAITLSHEPDGLIFQPSTGPYKAGRCDEVLKWKPPNLNSIDFRLKIVTVGGVGLIPRKEGHLFVGQCNEKVDVIKITKELKDLDGKIIECKYQNNEWKFMRERTDKSFPNSFETANAVLHTIARPITKEMLLDFIQRKSYDETMPPPAKRPRH